MTHNKPLPQSFYQRDTVQVAQELLGKILIRVWNNQTMAGIISETEAYCGPIDPASHAYSKKSERNASMFGPCGQTYVYFIYGNHYCLNLVSRDKNSLAGGTLIRSIIPIAGAHIMQQLRGNVSFDQLTNGPGKICQALALNRSHNMHDVTQLGELYVTQGITLSPNDIASTPRIGISKAQDYLWRFIIKDPNACALHKLQYN